MTNYRAAILADTPYTYYRLGDLFGATARDDGTAGLAYDGMLHGSMTVNQAGGIVGDPGASMKFGGAHDGSTGGSISLPAAFKVDGWTAFSLECWLKVSDTSFTDFARIASNDYTQNDNKGFELIVNPAGAGVTCNVGNGSTYASASKSTTLAGATWYHIVATYDGAAVKVYINGSPGSGVALTGGIGTATNAISLGYAPALSSNYLPAWMQEVAFYTVALSQAQVSAHRAAGLNSTTGPFTLQISRKPYTIQAGSMWADSAISRPSQAGCTVKTDTGTHFQQYQPVMLYDQSGVLYFSGYIDVPTEQKPGFPSVLEHTLTFMDQTWLANKRLVFDHATNFALEYKGKGYDFIVADFVTRFLAEEGVTIGQIYGLAPSATLAPSPTLAPLGPSVVIPDALFTFPSVAQALDALAKASSSSGITYYWYIDQYKRLYFMPYNATAGPTVDGATIDDGRLSHKPPSVIRANPLYYNMQYIAGISNNALTFSQFFKGDGNTTSWQLSYPVAAQPLIYVNGTQNTNVGRLTIDAGKDFYWSLNSQTITAANAVANGAQLNVAYIGITPDTATYTNASEVTAQAAIDGTSGKIESVVKDTSVIGLANGIAEAQANVTRNGQRGKRFEYPTRDTGYIPGQQISVTYAPFGFSSTPMLVESVHVDDGDRLNYWFSISAVVGPYDTTWTSFFGGALKTPPPQTAQSINIGV